MRLSISNLRRKQRSAFTMVEIALSLAVVGFALVAIVGVLPTGMTVQRDNREDTLIGQEGRFWLQAIKSGARGIEDLPKYVEQVVVTNGGNRMFNLLPAAAAKLNSAEIIALFSMPRSGTNDGTVARVKAITGAAADQGTNGSTFRYELRAEVTPVEPVPRELLHGNTNLQTFRLGMVQSLYDVRLVLRWPVVERGNGWYVGNNRKVFRGTIAGSLNRVFTNQAGLALPEPVIRTIVPNTFQYTAQ